MIESDSSINRENKLKLLKLAKNTVKEYHLPRFKVTKNGDSLPRLKGEAMMRVAGIPYKTNENLVVSNNKILGRMIPTALRIKMSDNNDKFTKYNKYMENKTGLKSKKDKNTNFRENPDKYNHIEIGNNGRAVIMKKSNGMNSSITAVTRLREGKKLSSIPWQWSCPMTFEMQSHQYTGAISSTRLGNENSQSNPTKGSEGYVPTGQLLYHSAGSGKTLLMILTAFFWMMKWWAKRSIYTESPSLNMSNSNSKKKNICNIIIFISEKDQVRDVKGKKGMDLFINIMGKLSDNNSNEQLKKFSERWQDFVRDLPQRKVTLKFSKENQPSKDLNDVKLYPDKDTYGVVKSWRNDDEVAIMCKGYHPFFKKPVPTMGMIREGEAIYKTDTKSQNKYFPSKSMNNTYIQNFSTDSDLAKEYKRNFPSSDKGYAQLNIYLKTITYVYSVFLMDTQQKNLNVIHSEAYNKLKLHDIYKNYTLSKGSYYQFTDEMIIQLYSRVKVFYTRAAANAGMCLSGPEGIGADGMRLHYKNINDGDNTKLVHLLREGDFVRFRVVGKSIKIRNINFDKITENGGLIDEKKAMHEHWKEWSEQNIGGVSPFFKVMSVKNVKFGENKDKSFIFISLQRMLIHKVTEYSAENIFHPLFFGNSESVQSDKEQYEKSKIKTSPDSNIKKGFEIYDIVRPTFKPQYTDPVETIFDSADMRLTQQTLPNQALKLILSHSGAEMRDNVSYSLAPKEDQNGASEWGPMNLETIGLGLSDLWWLSHGEHEAWETLDDEEMTKRWKDYTKTKNGTLEKSGKEDLIANMEKGITSPPMMPNTLFLGMTSQMALQLFHKFPDGALFIVDEIQKYVGNQDKPSSLSSINNIVERQNFFCMLSEAVKPQTYLCEADKKNNLPENKNIFNNSEKSEIKNEIKSERKSERKSENYTVFCQKAAELANTGITDKDGKKIEDFKGLPHLKPLKNKENSKRKFTYSPGGGQIQGASATPSIVTLDNNDPDSVNELERMFRLIGACRNQKIHPITKSMLKTKTKKTKDQKEYVQSPELVKKLYRKEMERYLQVSKIIISFIDLSMDVTKVPLSTSRGKDRVTGTSSIVEVDVGYKIRKQRTKPENFGTGDTVEERIGYPSMIVEQEQNNITAGTQKTAKAQTAKAKKVRGDWGNDEEMMRKQMKNRTAKKYMDAKN